MRDARYTTCEGLALWGAILGAAAGGTTVGFVCFVIGSTDDGARVEGTYATTICLPCWELLRSSAAACSRKTSWPEASPSSCSARATGAGS